jgi:hypothetical protein
VAHRPQDRVPRLPIGLSKLLTFFGNRKPNATASGVAAAGRIDRDAHNASLVAQRAVALHAIWQSGVNHPDNVVPNNNGSTIGTSHADLQGRSNLPFAKPRGAAMHSLRNSLGKHNVRSSKTSRAQTSLPEIPSTIGHVFAAKYTQREHLLGSQIGVESRAKIAAHRLRSPINIALMHLVVYFYAHRFQ